jgi:nicotinate phosphoribosyltransferase
MVNINTTSSPFEIRPAIRVGETADVYLQRALTILRNENVNPTVTMEFLPERSGVLCGMEEVLMLLGGVLPDAGGEVWSLDEGDHIESGEVALRIRAPYSSFGLYETALCGTLSSCTGWATAARECVNAAGGTAEGIPIVAAPARHIHPNVAATVDYAAVRGGCSSCSTIVGARMAGVTPEGDMPHALPLLLGDSVKAIQSFDRYLPQGVPRVALVDTFKDEAEEALNVAQALRDRLRGVRLDTPVERGGVSVALVKEVRARLDLAGLRHVEIVVSGRFDPDRIREFVEASAPVDRFIVGAYISGASPINFTADIHEVDGRPMAKRGRIPGVTANPRLDRKI